MRGRALVLLAAIAALVPAAGRAADEGFVVVVNEANPTQQLSRSDVSRLFLKRATTWPDGSRATPYDLSTTSPVRTAFTLAVHRKAPDVIRAYWDQEIYSGRSTPPRVHSTEQDVLHAVRSDPGAVGYVGSQADLGPGLRVLVLDP